MRWFYIIRVRVLRLRYRPAKVKLKLSEAARRFWETCITMYLYAKHSYLMKKIMALFPFPPSLCLGSLLQKVPHSLYLGQERDEQ